MKGLPTPGLGRLRIAAQLLSLMLVLSSSQAIAHPGEHEAIRSVLLDWANGVAHANRGQVDALLSENFRHESFFGAPQDRGAYLEEDAKHAEAHQVL